jgi:hypothetical protein
MNLLEKKHKYSKLLYVDYYPAVATAPSVAPAPFVTAAASVTADTAVAAVTSAAASAAATATMTPLLLLCSRRLCHCLPKQVTPSTSNGRLPVWGPYQMENFRKWNPNKDKDITGNGCHYWKWECHFQYW